MHQGRVQRHERAAPGDVDRHRLTQAPPDARAQFRQVLHAFAQPVERARRRPGHQRQQRARARHPLERPRGGHQHPAQRLDRRRQPGRQLLGQRHERRHRRRRAGARRRRPAGIGVQRPAQPAHQLAHGQVDVLQIVGQRGLGQHGVVLGHPQAGTHQQHQLGHLGQLVPHQPLAGPGQRRTQRPAHGRRRPGGQARQQALQRAQPALPRAGDGLVPVDEPLAVDGVHQRPQAAAVQLGHRCGQGHRHGRQVAAATGRVRRLAPSGGHRQRRHVLLALDQPGAQPGDQVAQVARPARGRVHPHHHQQIGQHAGLQQPPIQLAQELERPLALLAGGAAAGAGRGGRGQAFQQAQAQAGGDQRRLDVGAQVAALDERHLRRHDLLAQRRPAPRPQRRQLGVQHPAQGRQPVVLGRRRCPQQVQRQVGGPPGLPPARVLGQQVDERLDALQIARLQQQRQQRLHRLRLDRGRARQPEHQAGGQPRIPAQQIALDQQLAAGHRDGRRVGHARAQRGHRPPPLGRAQVRVQAALDLLDEAAVDGRQQAAGAGHVPPDQRFAIGQQAAGTPPARWGGAGS